MTIDFTHVYASEQIRRSAAAHSVSTVPHPYGWADNSRRSSRTGLADFRQDDFGCRNTGWRFYHRGYGPCQFTHDACSSSQRFIQKLWVGVSALAPSFGNLFMRSFCGSTTTRRAARADLPPRSIATIPCWRVSTWSRPLSHICQMAIPRAAWCCFRPHPSG